MRPPTLPVLFALSFWAAAPVASSPQAAAAPHSAEAAFRGRLGEIQKVVRSGRHTEALEAARRVVVEAEASFGEESLPVADALEVLLEALGHARGLAEGVPVSTEEMLRVAGRCLAIRERALGPDHEEVAESLTNLATVYDSLGNYRESLGLLTRTLAIYERRLGPDHSHVAWTLNSLGIVHGALADYARARELHERAGAIFERSAGPESSEVAASLRGQGLATQRLGDVAEAERLFRRSLAVNEKLLGPEHFRVTQTMALLADALRERGAYAEARITLERALGIRERTLGPRNHHTANLAQQLGGVLRRLSETDAARRTLERALEIHEAVQGRDHPSVAVDLHALGELRADQGDRAAARPLVERALAIRESRLGVEHPLTAESLRLLADLTDDPAAALGMLDRAVATFRASLAPFHPHVARALRDRARLHLRTGHAAAALASALESEDAARQWLRLAVRSLDERSALGAARTAARGLDIALSLAGAADAPAVEAVFDAVIRSRALVLDEMAARRHAARSADDPDVPRLEAELASRRERLTRLVLRGPAELPLPAYLSLVDEARRQKEETEAALGRHSRLFRDDLEEAGRGAAAVRAALVPGDALVSFVQYGRSAAGSVSVEPAVSYAAFVSRAGNAAAAFVPLGEAGSIDALVRQWRAALLRAGSGGAGRRGPAQAEYERAAVALRRRVWDPLAPRLNGAARAFLVPDGALHLVSFAALPDRGRTYLVESGPRLHHLSAERDLVDPSSAREGRGLLALGDPDFESAGSGQRATGTAPVGHPARALVASLRGESGCRTFDRLRFAPLPASGSEVEDLETLFDPGDTRGLRRAAATEAAVKEGAVGRRVLHLATHAFFLGEDCPSALGSAGADGAAPAGTLSPLLRAGLALAGANRHEAAPPMAEDGLLTAEEIASLDLHGMEWAVLSACGTGLGAIAEGEGVLGLSRAFRVAGVGATIMSLWPVDDEATRSWMRSLYRARFREGRATDEAVRAAALGALRDRRARGRSTHPFYWAAFIASGSWR